MDRTTVYPNPRFDGVKAIAFWTDVEGNWDYFLRLASRSAAVTVDPSGEGKLGLREGGALVYGGDHCDRGPGDIRISRALVQLKKRHPDRVVLLIGNRDVNKLRFGSELALGQSA